MMEKMKMMIISWGEGTNSSGNPFEEYHLGVPENCMCMWLADWLTGYGIKLVSGNLDGASYHVLHSKHHCRQYLQGWCIIAILSSLRWEAAKKTLHILAVLWHFSISVLAAFGVVLRYATGWWCGCRDAEMLLVFVASRFCLDVQPRWWRWWFPKDSRPLLRSYQ